VKKNKNKKCGYPYNPFLPPAQQEVSTINTFNNEYLKNSFYLTHKKHSFCEKIALIFPSNIYYFLKNGPLKCKSYAFSIQKHSFWRVKHHLLHAKTYAFAT